MPVSKKRKKDGKPVRRSDAGAQQHGEEQHAGGGAATPGTPRARVGKPSNPFVAQQQSKRGAQRGR